MAHRNKSPGRKDQGYRYLYLKGDTNKCNYAFLYVDIFKWPGKEKSLVFIAPADSAGGSSANALAGYDNYGYGPNRFTGKDLVNRYHSMFMCPPGGQSAAECAGKPAHTVVPITGNQALVDQCTGGIYSGNVGLCTYEDGKCRVDCVPECIASSKVSSLGQVLEPCVCADQYVDKGYCAEEKDPNTGTATQGYVDFDCATVQYATCTEYCPIASQSASHAGVVVQRECGVAQGPICSFDVCGVAQTEAINLKNDMTKNWGCE